jgi:chromosome segregation ATPase
MIDKIRALSNIGAEIDSIKKQIKSLSNDSKQFKEEFSNFLLDHEKLMESQKKQQEMIIESSKALNEIKTISDDFKKEIYDFKLMKTQMQKVVLERVENELKEELSSGLSNMREDAKKYEKLRNNLEILSSDIMILRDNIKKFSSIAVNIKESDFHLNKYYRNLDEMDKEKIHLLRKIDSLERLVAKIRRKN